MILSILQHTNRITSETSTIGEKTYSVGYENDLMDRVSKVQYPNGREVSYSYNQLGELISMPGYIAESPEYEFGLLKEITSVNGVETEYDYDKNGRLAHLNHSNTEGTIKEYDFTYDMVAGNIIQKNHDVFKYDMENRLTQAFLNGSFAVDVNEEIQNVGAVNEDLFGKKQLNYNLEEVVAYPSIIELDYKAGSIGVDLEDEYEVTKIELTALTTPNRVERIDGKESVAEKRKSRKNGRN